MKKLLLIVLILCLGVGLMAQTAEEPSGEGSEEQPYQIATLGNLYWLTQSYRYGGNVYVIQTADINASSSSSWDSNAGFLPMGDAVVAFTGNYDGQGYCIDSLFISRSSTDYVGFIGYVSSGATVENLGLTNVNITGNNDVGAFVGRGGSFTVSECYATGSINGSGNVGGISGTATSGSTVSSCYVDAEVNGSTNVGGINGFNRCSVTNCYSVGSVYASSMYAGGLVGELYQSTLTKSYSCADVSVGSFYAGGLVGYNGKSTAENAGSATGCFWNTDTIAAGSNGEALFGISGRNTTQMQTKTTFTAASWDFTNVWRINPTHNDNFPYINAIAPEAMMPITLDNFSVEYSQGQVQINWVTESEENNARFLIYRNDEVIAMIDGAGTSTETHNYSYTDKEVIPGMSYVYKLADVSYANELVIHEDYAVTISIDENDISGSFALKANYPNPFNPATVIPFELGSQSSISLCIFDINGKLVRTLLNETCNAGCQEVIWDGKNNSGLSVESGMYIARLLTENTSEFIKMMLVK